MAGPVAVWAGVPGLAGGAAELGREAVSEFALDPGLIPPVAGGEADKLVPLRVVAQDEVDLPRQAGAAGGWRERHRHIPGLGELAGVHRKVDGEPLEQVAGWTVAAHHLGELTQPEAVIDAGQVQAPGL